MILSLAMPCSACTLTRSLADCLGSQVEYFMADPSCSGSGIVTRYDVAFTTGTVQQATTNTRSVCVCPCSLNASIAAAPDEGEWVDLGDEDEKKKRLAGLAAFQTSIIAHCLKCT
jgi:16S rRNA C967 or C1407 C5-methylase (RsmB/RsmF family)